MSEIIKKSPKQAIKKDVAEKPKKEIKSTSVDATINLSGEQIKDALQSKISTDVSNFKNKLIEDVIFQKAEKKDTQFDLLQVENANLKKQILIQQQIIDNERIIASNNLKIGAAVGIAFASIVFNSYIKYRQKNS